jgi:putative inorganic carbon (hco3(-)) transporter
LDRRLATDLGLLLALVAGATIFHFSPPHLALPLLAVFAVLAWIRIDLALLSVIVFVPYFAHPKTVLGHHFPTSEWLLIVVGGVAVIAIVTAFIVPVRESTAPAGRLSLPRPATPRWKPLLTSPFLWPGTVFLLAACMSTLVAAERGLAAREVLEVVLEPMALFALLLLFAPCRREPGEPVSASTGHSDVVGTLNRYILLVGITVALTGVAPSLIALGQLVTRQHLVLVSGAGYTRVPGPYGSPDNLGLLIDRTIPMALSLLLAPAAVVTAYVGARSHVLRIRGARLILFTTVGLMCAALLVTFVLGAWLGTAVAAFAILLARFRPGWWVVAPAGLILVAGLALGLGKAHTVTAGNRMNIWRSAIHIIRDHPVLGIGPDNFQHYYAPIRGDNVSPRAHSPSGKCRHGLGYMEPAASAEPCLSHPHDEFLDFWLSTGIVGLVAFISLEFVFWRVVWNHRRVLRDTPVLLGAGGAMLAGLLHGLVDNGYFLVDLGLLFWVLLALASLYHWSSSAISYVPQKFGTSAA